MGKGKKKNKKKRIATKFVKIANIRPLPAANDYYFSLIAQLSDDVLESVKAELSGRKVKKAQELGETLKGKNVEVLFTLKQVVDAIYRAARNPEDVPTADAVITFDD
tara:strand:- start:105 stop:425 length:321 start_codon:yes stop_codon:yes gene_type:complete